MNKEKIINQIESELFNKYPAIQLNFSDYQVVYFKNKLYGEGHRIHRDDWINLGIEMYKTYNHDITIKEIDISENVQEKYSIWSMKNIFSEFNEEFLKYIISEVKQ